MVKILEVIKILGLVLHIALIILSILNAKVARSKGSRVCWIICSVLWSVCTVIDILQLIGIA